MIKKLIHFSDLHIKLYKDHRRYREILKRCFKEWKELSPDRIVFTGDLVHSKNQITPELLDMVTWVLTQCVNICKTLVLIGNHDFLENNLERLDTLSPIISTMNNDNILYLKESGIVEDENIMWVVYSLVNNNNKPIFIPNIAHTYIGLFHGPIQGLVTDMGFAFEDGYNINGFKGCDVVLAGDIHKRQIVDIPDNKKGYMVGSLIQQNFGEGVKNHGYGIYDVKEDNYIFKDIENTSPYLNFKIKDIIDIENEEEKLTNF
jgi:DNA repair exonuclease SbcCD nuclease subunit